MKKGFYYFNYNGKRYTIIVYLNKPEIDGRFRAFLKHYKPINLSPNSVFKDFKGNFCCCTVIELVFQNKVLARC